MVTRVARAPDRGATSCIDVAGYSVTIGRNLLDGLGQAVAAVAPAHRFALIADSNVMRLYGERAAKALGRAATVCITIEAGEANKTRDAWARATDEMLAAGLGRDTTVVALGGGVTGDVAGFVASTFMRGVAVVQVPTSLLAMLDASIGGKTGVDTVAGKNLVGTFHAPAAVIADVSLLATLPSAEFRSGMAEAIKHGVIASADHLRRIMDKPSPEAWRDMSRNGEAGGDALADLIAHSAAIKADVVRTDGREAGKRAWLNFGHTIGHAVELLSGYRLLHGEAVAIGMVLEARLAERLGIARAGTADEVTKAVRWAGLPEALPAGIPAADVVAATRGDKKARSGSAQYALPASVGKMAGGEAGWTVAVADADVLEVLK